jgi:hypothetical protein
VRLLVTLLIAGVALSVLQYALAVLMLAFLLLLVWGAIVHPAETVGGLAFFLFATVLVNHTLATLGAIAFLGFWLIVRRPDAPPSNTDERNH